ncbi:MAG: hypothetical protein HON53_02965 [Planctomycetaceae bacterium]|jgi:hypothetical protein|nr:hypothetical protein [Planctomycetaceae bacterium]MBT6154703.1 hypothetical protein [Planctomycetaceae bacterium]MBT6485897.1 hypothetical protein [Planctomycetaceae bacterium]MBT6493469.1 hypothetical protein [Planctomycetaceae bacterium]
MRYVVWGLLLILVVLHQSGIAIDSTKLLFGFLPEGLAVHIGISLAAGATWLLATLYAWPIDESSESENAESSNGGERP